MNVTRPAYATGTDVISLADIKEFLRVDHDDEDTTVGALLDTAVAHVSDYTNRSFLTGGEATFFLNRWRPAALAFGPVKTIQHVKYFDTAGVLQTLDSSKYYTDSIRDNSTIIYFHDVPDLQEYNAQPVYITATVGTTPSANIKHAVRMLCAHWYENRRAVITGTVATQMPMAVESLLNPERIVDLRQ